MKEYILCAAVWLKDGNFWEHQPKNIETGYVVAGRRHHNCFMTIACIRNKNVRRLKFPEEIQGFLTNLDRFVDREEGGKIAFEAGQMKKLTTCLFSEDLY